jgi:hypothetical protein
MLRCASACGFVSALLAVAGPASAPGASAEGPSGEKNQPGWPDVFISLGMYGVAYEKPVVGKGDKPESYRQKAIYSWTGGRFEILEVTLARDPAFKDRYSPEALKKEKDPPKELQINKKKAWLWIFPREAGELEQVARRLVVLLDADKAIIIEQKGAGANLEDVARRFDFPKVERALAKPPTR